MIIKKIRLKNFHKFNDIEFKFNERFTALAGENAVAIGGFLAGIKDVDSRNIRADEVRLSQFDNGGIINIEPQYPSKVICDAYIQEKSYNWKRLLNSKKGKTIYLQVTWFNQGAYKFYEELGFKVIENKCVFPDWRRFYE